MNIVYLLMNVTKFEKGEKPFLYIGSKVDCEVINNEMVDKHGRKYWSSSIPVMKSIRKGDVWELFDYFQVFRNHSTLVEGIEQKKVNAARNENYYNLAQTNGVFNSMQPGVGKQISRALKGKRRPEMYKPEYYSHMHTPEVRKKNAEARKGNPKVINAAIKRCENQKKDPEWVKWRSELSSRTFKGKVLTDHEIWLRKHDDRYKPGRKLSNQQVWEIRFGKDKHLSLNELLLNYPDVSKATLSRVRNFKVFKDITEDWTNEQ